MQSTVSKWQTDIEKFKKSLSDKVEKEEMKDDPNDDKIDEWEGDEETMEAIGDSIEELEQAITDARVVIEDALNA